MNASTDMRAPHQSSTDELLTGVWHLAAVSRHIPRGTLTREIIADNPIAIGRTRDGRVFALDDACPHRAAPLSRGRIVDRKAIGANGDSVCVECPYHGWRFDTQSGACVDIPALSDASDFDIGPISTRCWRVAESHGLIWIYLPAGDNRGASGPSDAIAPPVASPELPLPADMTPRSVTIVEAAGPYDEAVIGLVDPAHTPFVHKQWWWREGAERREKEKQFEPTSLGFRMPPHTPSSNSRIYRLLGGAPTTAIEFRIPGLRLETIRNRRHTILGLTAITPLTAGRNRITHCLFWDMALLTALTPIIDAMAASFLSQDGAILEAQSINLSPRRRRPLYAGDPDTPAQWYFALKRAWREATRNAEPFENPLQAGTLRWRT